MPSLLVHSAGLPQVSRNPVILGFLISVPLLFGLDLFSSIESSSRVLKLKFRWRSGSQTFTLAPVNPTFSSWPPFFWRFTHSLVCPQNLADWATPSLTISWRNFRVADAAPYWSGIKNQSKFHLSLVSEWLRLLPFLGVLALLGYLAVRPFLPKKKQQKDSLINLKIQKENPKVVNEINIEDLCLTKAYCRCWRSKTVRQLCASVGLEIATCMFLSVLCCWIVTCWPVAFLWKWSMFLFFWE